MTGEVPEDLPGSEREDVQFDWQRGMRTGVPEAVLAEGKSADQIAAILHQAASRQTSVLVTRLGHDVAEAVTKRGVTFDYDAVARLAIFGSPPLPASDAPKVGIVTAGTSDMPVAREAELSARFMGLRAALYPDCGVAGLWRLMDRVETLDRHPVLIAVAGMEGALFSVLAGLVTPLVIAVPSSVGYGVGAEGRLALNAALGGCAPGVVTVNIDNGFGAAAAARKLLRATLPER